MDRRPVTTPFAHASEAEMSRILDFYAVRWEYEPHTFPILWNLDGEVVESFAPDFYLPDLDLYLEMTTLRQKLVRKKNRKLRRLRELYPDLNVKLFYARDFRALMLKYGRLALVDGLSGTLGQVAAPHGAALVVEPVVPAEIGAASAATTASDRPARSGRRRAVDHDAPIGERVIQA
jgi:hypoxanthine phosphoribosyltransferase